MQDHIDRLLQELEHYAAGGDVHPHVEQMARELAEHYAKSGGAYKYPQDDAMEQARINAIRLLGLHEHNTAHERAHAMGFTGTGFHSTAHEIDRIDPSRAQGRAGPLGNGFYIDPSDTASYSNLVNRILDKKHPGEPRRIMPIMYKPKDLFDATQSVAIRDPESSTRETKALQEAGHSGAYRRKEDQSDTLHEVAMYDPSHVRSRFAAFDPARAHEAGLSYSEGGEVNHPHIDQMMHELAHYAAGGQPERASEALGKHEGKTLMVTQADRTRVGGGYLGGPGFSGMQHTDPAYEGKAWGVMNTPMSSTIAGSNRRVPEGQALWSTLIGTPEQHSSNQMVFDKLVRDFKKHAKAGLLSPELLARINSRLSASADKEGTPFFGEGADIMGKGTTGSADTFAKRRIIADIIGGHGVGGKKGQIGNYDEIMRKATDPMLRDVPTHAIGNRLFSLTGETSNRPDLHPAFPQMLHGEDFGQTYHPVPKEMMLRDYMNQFQEEKGRKPGYMDLTLGYSPTQHLSEDFLSHLQKNGYADGGSVEPSYDQMLAYTMMHKAEGGAVRRPTELGVDEAPNSDVKWYMPPGSDGRGMPVGGVDFQPQAPGQQFAAQQPQGMPGQQPQGMLGQPPQGMPGEQAPAGPPSNILNMTPQGQAMSAMKAPQAAPAPVPQRPNPSPLIKNGMARMAEGGSVKPVARGIIKERVTVTPTLRQMQYELMQAKKVK